MQPQLHLVGFPPHLCLHLCLPLPRLFLRLHSQPHFGHPRSAKSFTLRSVYGGLDLSDLPLELLLLLLQVLPHLGSRLLQSVVVLLVVLIGASSCNTAVVRECLARAEW